MVKRIRIAELVVHMISPETSYALKHGEYVVAVEHVLDVISTAVTPVL
jgi:hypothetical protein